MKFYSLDRLLLFNYFLGNIVVGWILLSLPFSWEGSGKSLVPIDALFTAVSAVCVTGLVTVSTTDFSFFGQLVLLYLIQAGGLGIITFSTLVLVFPRGQISLKRRMIIMNYHTEQSPSSEPRKIIQSILLLAISFESIGFILLAIAFVGSGEESPLFAALFHAVSAFCNAGFSLFPQNLTNYLTNVLVNITVMTLVIAGGLGFMVLQHLGRKIRTFHTPLPFHSKIVLVTTSALLGLGMVGYFLSEYHHTLSGLSLPEKLLASLFQSVTTRTAGFNTVQQSEMSLISQILTLPLMFVGGGSGSTAGGIKVSTFFLLSLILFKGMRDEEDMRVFRRRVEYHRASTAAIIFLKAIVLVTLSLFLLTITERRGDQNLGALPLLFETLSAFGTVGLSTGITPLLTAWGKGILMVTMFLGRVGLFAMLMPVIPSAHTRRFDYPKGEVLLG